MKKLLFLSLLLFQSCGDDNCPKLRDGTYTVLFSIQSQDVDKGYCSSDSSGSLYLQQGTAWECTDCVCSSNIEDPTCGTKFYHSVCPSIFGEIVQECTLNVVNEAQMEGTCSLTVRAQSDIQCHYNALFIWQRETP